MAFAVFIGTKTAYAAASPVPPAYADHMTGMGSKPLHSSSTYFVVRTIRCRNRPRRFHAFVEIRRDRRKPVVRLSGEPPRDPNQSGVPPVIKYNRLTPGEAKETHPLSAQARY